MAKICGVSMSGNDGIISVVEGSRNDFKLLESTYKKITIADDKDQKQIKEFYHTIEVFLQENDIEAIYIKKSSSSGRFKAGATAFKIEALLQLSNCDVKLVPPASIAALLRKVDIPENILTSVYKYQIDSLKVAFYGLEA